jgi:hypothetical protein
MLTNIVSRIKNWKMTLFGTGVGAAFASVVSYILITQAHCDFSQVSLAATLTFAGSALVGAIGTDNGQSVE